VCVDFSKEFSKNFPPESELHTLKPTRVGFSTVIICIYISVEAFLAVA
jgi:hypothetical protein